MPSRRSPSAGGCARARLGSGGVPGVAPVFGAGKQPELLGLGISDLCCVLCCPQRSRLWGGTAGAGPLPCTHSHGGGLASLPGLPGHPRPGAGWMQKLSPGLRWVFPPQQRARTWWAQQGASWASVRPGRSQRSARCPSELPWELQLCARGAPAGWRGSSAGCTRRRQCSCHRPAQSNLGVPPQRGIPLLGNGGSQSPGVGGGFQEGAGGLRLRLCAGGGRGSRSSSASPRCTNPLGLRVPQRGECWMSFRRKSPPWTNCPSTGMPQLRSWAQICTFAGKKQGGNRLGAGAGSPNLSHERFQ